MTTVLVTGAGGFVGSHLRETLSAKGYDVVTFERDDGDICDMPLLRGFVSRVQPAVVYHLAAQSSAARSFQNPAGTFHVNVTGTVSLLEAIRLEAPDARVVVASSSEVYGAMAPDEAPLDESAPLRPLNPYAASKAAQELATFQYVRAFGCDVIVARCFNSVGPRQAQAFALPSFAAQLARIAVRETEPILYVGNLDVRRDYTDVRDVARALMLLGERGARGETYNVCSRAEVSLRTALDLLARVSGVDVRIEVEAQRVRPADIPRIVGSYALLNEATGWRPEVPLERSLADLYQYELGRLD